MGQTIFGANVWVWTITIIITLVVVNSCSECGTKEITTNIYSLDVITGTHGSFILGSGSIDSTAYYYFYVKEDDGYILRKLYAETTIIEESFTDEPRIIEYDCTCYGVKGVFGNKCEIKRNRLIVPNGTIHLEYDGEIR